jgi:tetratricopeptide (TPR) repeat protein
MGPEERAFAARMWDFSSSNIFWATNLMFKKGQNRAFLLHEVMLKKRQWPAIQRSPNSAIFYFDEGNAYRAMGELKSALDDYAKAIQYNETYTNAYLAQAQLFLDTGVYDRAVADADKAIELDAARAEPYRIRGAANLFLGSYAASIHDFEKAIEMAPEDPATYIARGEAHVRLGEVESGIKDFNESLHLNPNVVHALNNRGNAYRLQGRYELSIRDLTDAILIDPNFITAYENRGQAYFDVGNFSSAAADFLRLSQLTMYQNPEALLYRYLAFARTGADADSELRTNMGTLTNKAWPYPLLEFLLGRMSVEESLAFAASAAERCTALFVAGEWYLLHTRPWSAESELREAVDGCPKWRVEYGSAIAELKRLKPN